MQLTNTAPRAQGVDSLHTVPVVPVQTEGLQPLGESTDRASLFLPFDAQTGLAAFWSGSSFVVVADHAALAMARVSGGTGLFAGLHVSVMDHATLVVLSLPAHPQLALTQHSGGWELAVSSGGSKKPLMPEQGRGYVRFPMAQPGQVVAMPDPASGARLFVATSRQATGGIAQPMQGIGYSVKPSLEGAVVVADSEQIFVRATPRGPVLQALSLHPVPIGQPLYPQADTPVRRKDWQWLELDHASSAVLSPLPHPLPDDPARRLALAHAALLAGNAKQAEQLLAPSASHPSSGAEGQGEQFFRAVVALLAGPIGSASTLADVTWYAWPELHVWQGLYALKTGQDSQITSILLAQGARQLAQYPAGVRDLVFPQLATYLARYGTESQRNVLPELPDGSAYDLPRALLLARSGKIETARIALENLTASSNPITASYAQVALVRLLRDADQIAPDMAVDVYGKLLRPSGPEQALSGGPRQQAHLGLALAYSENGQSRAALAGLDSLQPGEELPSDSLADAYSQVLYRLVFGTLRGASEARGTAAHSAEGLSGEDVAQLVGQALPKVRAGAAKAKLLTGYGRLLLSLGKAAEAQRRLDQAAQMQPDPLARSEIQDFLAQAALQQGHLADAQAATDQILLTALQPDLAARKAYNAARIAQARGETAKALTLLAQDETDAGLDLRGKLYESDRQWAQAVQAVGRLASRSLPTEGPLTDSQKILVLRLATDAAAARDQATLHTLKDWLAGRSLGRERDTLLKILLQTPGKSKVSP
ncbi:MAG: tetratricopeptide repeat protein [Acetobacter cibinongensis]